MRKRQVPRIAEVLMLVISVCGLMCLAFGGEFSPERLDKIHEEDKRWSDWLNKYIKGVLYVGMPADEFVKIFSKDESRGDPEKPYIIDHDKNRYIIIGRKGIKYRTAFKDGLLEKLEQYTWEKIPVVTAHYEDVTRLLKGYNNINGPGFHDGMTENEFLKKFSDSILSHSRNCYVVIGKNGWKYRITFSKEGFLIGIDTLRSN